MSFYSDKAIAGAHGLLSERNLAIADVVGEVDREAGVANPGVTALLLGARTLRQLESNLGALDVVLSTEHLARLEEASAIKLAFPHDLLRGDLIRVAVGGGTRLPQRSW